MARVRPSPMLYYPLCFPLSCRHVDERDDAGLMWRNAPQLHVAAELNVPVGGVSVVKRLQVCLQDLDIRLTATSLRMLIEFAQQQQPLDSGDAETSRVRVGSRLGPPHSPSLPPSGRCRSARPAGAWRTRRGAGLCCRGPFARWPSCSRTPRARCPTRRNAGRRAAAWACLRATRGWGTLPPAWLGRARARAGAAAWVVAGWTFDTPVRVTPPLLLVPTHS